MSKENIINHPDHYSFKSLECSVVIEAMTENLEGYSSYCVGNIVKYLYRFPLKNGIEDLRKARKYLEFLKEEVSQNPSLINKENNPDNERLAVILGVMTEKLYGYTGYLVGKVIESLFTYPKEGVDRLEEALKDMDSLIAYQEDLGVSNDSFISEEEEKDLEEEDTKEKKNFWLELGKILLVALLVMAVVEGITYLFKFF